MKWQLFKGTTKTFRVALKDTSLPKIDDDTYQPLNLTGASDITLEVDISLQQAAPAEEFIFTISGLSTDGVIERTFVPADTDGTGSLDPAKYNAQFVITYTSTKVYKSPIFDFVIDKNVKE